MDSSKDNPFQFVAPTLIATLLSAFPDREVSVQSLLKAGALFDATERGIRVALGRLSLEKKVKNTSRGHYMVGERAEGVHRAVAEWRPAEVRTSTWTGNWYAVYGGNVNRTNRAALLRHERALKLKGFRDFLPSLWVRPDNLREHISIESELRDLGLHPNAHLFVASRMESALDAKARSLWKSEKLEKTYSANLKVLEQSARRLHRMSQDAALVETLSVGRSVIRDIVLDPFLPEELVDVTARQAMIQGMIAYDEIANKMWQDFLF
jgi:phenylacetic acid degradation operon negative regulatory protein